MQGPHDAHSYFRHLHLFHSSVPWQTLLFTFHLAIYPSSKILQTVFSPLPGSHPAHGLGIPRLSPLTQAHPLNLLPSLVSRIASHILSVTPPAPDWVPVDGPCRVLLHTLCCEVKLSTIPVPSSKGLREKPLDCSVGGALVPAQSQCSKRLILTDSQRRAECAPWEASDLQALQCNSEMRPVSS